MTDNPEGFGGAFSSRAAPDPTGSAFFSHVSDKHLDPHPQYATDVDYPDPTEILAAHAVAAAQLIGIPGDKFGAAVNHSGQIGGVYESVPPGDLRLDFVGFVAQLARTADVRGHLTGGEVPIPGSQGQSFNIVPPAPVVGQRGRRCLIVRPVCR